MTALNHDLHRFISFEVLQVLFPEETVWMKNNAYKLMSTYPGHISSLSNGKFSFHYVCQIKEKLLKEASDKAKAEAHQLSPASLTGSHRN
jgi:hypothetical protein